MQEKQSVFVTWGQRSAKTGQHQIWLVYVLTAMPTYVFFLLNRSAFKQAQQEAFLEGKTFDPSYGFEGIVLGLFFTAFPLFLMFFTYMGSITARNFLFMYAVAVASIILIGLISFGFQTELILIFIGLIYASILIFRSPNIKIFLDQQKRKFLNRFHR